MELVIMAAGMGTRFGGLKQIEVVGKNNEFIIDYNIYDALKNGFDKVIFIIKKEFEEKFRKTIGKRIESFVSVKYVYQSEEFFNSNFKRIKPWGTAHALYAAKDEVTSNFAVINADDYYGEDCFKTLAKYIKNMKENEFATVGYKVENTISNSGSVKRGILVINKGNVIDITESKIKKTDGDIYMSPLIKNSYSKKISKDTLVSMNALAFSPKIFELIEEEIPEFIKNEDLDNAEFLLPEILKSKINENKIVLKSLDTTATWYGMTYEEDKEEVVKAISKMINNGVYPENLWKIKNK